MLDFITKGLVPNIIQVNISFQWINSNKDILYNT